MVNRLLMMGMSLLMAVNAVRAQLPPGEYVLIESSANPPNCFATGSPCEYVLVLRLWLIHSFSHHLILDVIVERLASNN